MPVRIGDDVYWLYHCHETAGTHLYVSAYLITHAGGNILVDTGSFHHTDEIVDQIDAVTDGTGLDTLVLSHPDLPHSGNLSALRTEWEDLELIVFSRTPPIHGFTDATSATRGDVTERAGRLLSWIDAPLADITSTGWVYDHSSETLFTADGFGAYHGEDECGLTSADLTDRDRVADIRAYNADVLPWIRYVVPGAVRSTVESLLDGYDVRCVAPAHGYPLLGEGIDRYLDDFEQSVQELTDDYTPHKI